MPYLKGLNIDWELLTRHGPGCTFTLHQITLESTNFPSKTDKAVVSYERSCLSRYLPRPDHYKFHTKVFKRRIAHLWKLAVCMAASWQRRTVSIGSKVSPAQALILSCFSCARISLLKWLSTPAIITVLKDSVVNFEILYVSVPWGYVRFNTLFNNKFFIGK